MYKKTYATYRGSTVNTTVNNVIQVHQSSSVASRTELKALLKSSLTNGINKTLTSLSGTDGLGGAFRWDPASAVAADDVDVIAVNEGGNGRFIRISGGLVTGSLTSLQSIRKLSGGKDGEAVVRASINDLSDKFDNIGVFTGPTEIRALGTVPNSNVPRYAIIQGVNNSGHDPGAGVFVWKHWVVDNDGANGIRPGSSNGTFKRITDKPFDVGHWGAYGGDGSVNDHTAIAAVTNAALYGGVTHFREGTYRYDAWVNCNGNQTWRGAGIDKTVIKSSAVVTNPYMVQNTLDAAHITIEDITFDGNEGTGHSWCLSFGTAKKLIIRRCKFRGLPSCILLSNVQDVLIEDCIFEPGCELLVNAYNAVSISGGCKNIKFKGCYFWYAQGGISISAPSSFISSLDTDITEDIVVEDCYFDGAWWTAPTFKKTGNGNYHTGSYLTTTFTNYVSSSVAITLTDTAASFPAFEAYADNVRVLHKRASGTLTSVTARSFVDNTKAFSTTFPRPGPGWIVRAGNAFGIVSNTQNATEVNIERWIDAYNMQPYTGSISGAYNLYQCYFGRIFSNTATSITTYDGYFDWTGRRLDANYINGLSASLSYEVIKTHGIYAGIHAETGCHRIRVVNSTFMRSWADQISLYGNDHIVANNYVIDGWDTGITINGHPTFDDDVYTSSGGGTIVIGNKVDHHGANGIWGNGHQMLIANNICRANQWINSVNWVYAGDITIAHDRILCTGNICDGMNYPYATYGISIASSNVYVSNNKCQRHFFGGVAVYNETYEPGNKQVHNEQIVDNDLWGERTQINHIWRPNYTQLLQSGSLGPRISKALEAGTSPPDIIPSIIGAIEQNRHLEFRIEITTSGSRGTATFKWSDNAGTSYTTGITTAANVTLGSTNVSVAFSVGEYNTDNVYTFYAMDGSNGLYKLSGNGHPTGSAGWTGWAGKGSTYLRRDGGVGSTFYVKETDSGSNVWTAK